MTTYTLSVYDGVNGTGGDLVQVNLDLADRRKAREWTQPEFGRKMGVTGQTVYRWESGGIYPPLPTLLDMAGMFGELGMQYKGRRFRLVAEDVPTPPDDGRTGGEEKAELSDLAPEHKLLRAGVEADQFGRAVQSLGSVIMALKRGSESGRAWLTETLRESLEAEWWLRQVHQDVRALYPDEFQRAQTLADIGAREDVAHDNLAS